MINHHLETLSTQLGLTPEQQEEVATDYLRELNPGRLPLPIFTQVARLATLGTVEMGMMKPPAPDERSPHILLTQRSENDPWWPNQWHVPGSVILASDKIAHDHDYTPAVDRVVKEVGGSVVLVTEPTFFDTVHRGDPDEKTGDGKRGSEVTVHVIAEVEGEPEHGMFFEAADVLLHPPEGGLIQGHQTVIQKMAAYYKQLRAQNS